MARMRRRGLPGVPDWRRWRRDGIAPASPHGLDWAVAWVRWALLAASFLFALLSPPLGQLDQRAVSLALLLAYNALVELLRRRLPRCAASPGCPSLIWPSPR